MKISPPRTRPRSRRTAIAAASLAVTAVLVLSGCGGSANGGSSGDGGLSPVKVSVVADLTGTAATSNGLAAAGIRAAIDRLNTAGDGRPIDVTVYDSKSTPDQAQIAARQAVGDEPSVVAYAALSSGLLGARTVFDQAATPVVSVAAVEELMTPDLAPWYFTVASAPEQSAQGFVQVLEEQLGDLDGKKIGFHGLDSSAVNAILAYTEELLEEDGAEVVAWEKSTGAAIASYSAQAQKIVGLGAEAVISIDLIENFVIVGQALQAAGFDGPYLNPDAASSDPIFERLANPEFYGGRPYNLAREGSEMADAAEELGGDVDYTGTFYAYGWVVGNLIADAVANCTDECAPDDMTAALEGIDSYTPPGDVVWGPLSFSPTKHNGLTALQYFHWLDGEVVTYGEPIQVG